MDSFWESVKSETAYFSDGTLNAAHNALDKHKGTPVENKEALVYESENGTVTTLTFGDLIKCSNKIANLLIGKGVAKGDRVFLFLPRIPELYFSFLGILKTGAIAGTMFSAFGKDALKDRLENSEARVVLTTKELAERISQVKSELPKLEHILIVDSDEFKTELNTASEEFETVHTKPEDYAFMLYTSGTTGKPKGIVHAHGGIIQQQQRSKTRRPVLVHCRSGMGNRHCLQYFK
jgi:acetyl-CoA synthetase